MDTAALRLHVQVLHPPPVSIDTMIGGMRQVYASAAIDINLIGVADVIIPGVDPQSFPVGACDVPGGTQVTPAKAKLFANRGGALPNDVVIYVVRTFDGGQQGCSTHPAGMPGAMLSSLANTWTLAHEVGHLLGLPHVLSSDYLMYCYGTTNFTRVPPLLDASEIAMMRKSSLLSFATPLATDVRMLLQEHVSVSQKLRQMPKDADSVLLALAQDDDPLVASQAVYVGSHRPTAAAARAIVAKGLRHPLAHVRLVAASALKRDPRVRPKALSKVIDAEDDVHVRRLLTSAQSKATGPRGSRRTKKAKRPRKATEHRSKLTQQPC